MDLLETERSFSDEVTVMNTLPEMLEATADRHPERPAQSYKGGLRDRSLVPEAVPEAESGEYETITYREMRDVVRRLATGFRGLGIELGDRVGIFADTSMEWAQSDFAIMAAGGVVTTVYKSSSPAQVEYLLDDPSATGVVVENATLLERVLDVEDELALDWIVSMADLDGEYDDRPDILTLGEVFAQGRDHYDQRPTSPGSTSATSTTSPASSTRPGPPASPRASS